MEEDVFMYSILVHDNDACLQALLNIRVITNIPKDYASMHTNQYEEQMQL